MWLRRRCSLLADTAELDWSSTPQEAVRALAQPMPDYILAADCLYIDEVQCAHFGPVHAFTLLSPSTNLQMMLAQGGSTPCAVAFMHTCAALWGPGTSCYVALEQRSSGVMKAFHAGAAANGFLLVYHHAHS